MRELVSKKSDRNQLGGDTWCWPLVSICIHMEKCTHIHLHINVHTPNIPPPHTFAHTYTYTYGSMFMLHMPTISYPEKRGLRRGCIWDESGDCYTLLTLLHVSQWDTPDLLCLLYRKHMNFRIASSAFALSEDPHLVPSSHIKQLIIAYNTLSRGSEASGLQGHWSKKKNKTWILCSHLDFIPKIAQIFGCDRNALVLPGTLWWKGWHCAKWWSFKRNLQVTGDVRQYLGNPLSSPESSTRQRPSLPTGSSFSFCSCLSHNTLFLCIFLLLRAAICCPLLRQRKRQWLGSHPCLDFDPQKLS